MIRPQTWPRNSLQVCLLVPQSCLITLVFCPPRLMAPLILNTLLPSPSPLLLFLNGKTTHQETCVLNSFLPASVVTLWVSIARWLNPSRLTCIAFFRLFELSMLLIKMYLKLKLKHFINNQETNYPRFLWELGHSAHNVCSVEVVGNEMLLTFFIAGLSNSSVQWEVRKAKPAYADAALQAAVETHSFHENDVLKLETSGVNIISNEALLDTYWASSYAPHRNSRRCDYVITYRQKCFPKQSRRSFGQSKQQPISVSLTKTET